MSDFGKGLSIRETPLLIAGEGGTYDRRSHGGAVACRENSTRPKPERDLDAGADGAQPHTPGESPEPSQNGATESLRAAMGAVAPKNALGN